jgi:TolA-binding protein
MTNKTLLIISFLFGFLLSVVADECFADASTQTVKAVAPNTSGLVARYEFEGEANDISGTNHGTSYGNPAYVAGVSGQAINLDGNGDYVNCGKAPSFDLANQFTVAAWIKVGTFDKKYQTIIAKGDNSWRLAQASGTDNIEFACNGTAITRWTGKGEVPWSVSGTTGVNDGKWHHIAGVFDGSGLYLYIDGILEAAKGAGNSIDISNHDMCIGANAQVPGREWKGLIEDVRIYNYALSQAEIVSVMGKNEINLSEPVPATLYNIAKKYDGLKKREEAKGLCQLILQKYPDSPFARNAQIYISKRDVLSLIQSKDFTTAQAELDSLIADFNDHLDLAEALNVIAQAYSPPRKFKEAESVYKKLIQMFPDSPYAIEALFRAPKIHIFYLIKSGNHTEAQVAIDKFVTDFAENAALPGVLYWFGKEYEASKTYDRAKNIYQQIAWQYPDSAHVAKAWLGISRVDALSLIESGNDSEVQAAIDRLIADFSDNPELPPAILVVAEEYYRKAMLLAKQESDSRAAEYYRKAVAVWERLIKELPASVPHTPQAYYCSAVCYSQELAEYLKGIDYYQKVVDNWPRYEFAWHAQYFVGKYYEKLRNSGSIPDSEANPKIEQAYNNVVEKYPKSKSAPGSALKLAQMNFEKGQRIKAIKYYELFLKLADPSDTRIKNVKSRLEQLKGEEQ